MLCKKCGSEIADGSAYCSKCGEKQEVEQNANNSVSQNVSPTAKEVASEGVSILRLIVVIIMIVVGLSALLMTCGA